MGSTWSHILLPRLIRVQSYRQAHWRLPLWDGAPVLNKKDLNLWSPSVVFAIPRSRGSNLQLLPLPSAMPCAISSLHGHWFLPLWLECNSPFGFCVLEPQLDLHSRVYPLCHSFSLSPVTEEALKLSSVNTNQLNTNVDTSLSFIITFIHVISSSP